MEGRKIVQIAFDVSGDVAEGIGSALHALCEDGSVWYYDRGIWKRWDLPPIPQPTAEEK